MGVSPLSVCAGVRACEKGQLRTRVGYSLQNVGHIFERGSLRQVTPIINFLETR
jgi:hypothetical protein